MTRVKIKFPEYNALFKCMIKVRITDINYGGHLGNDSLLSLLHEARVLCLQSWGMKELNEGETSLIMADVMIAYKNEAFQGEELQIEIWAENITHRSFDFLYKVQVQRDAIWKDVAHVKTGMVTFDYTERRIVNMGEAWEKKLKNVD